MTVSEYNSCVDMYADGIYRFVLKHLRDKEAAQDIVQDTFEKLWVKHSTVDYAKAKSYMFTTAHHTMLNQIKRDGRKEKWDDNFEQGYEGGQYSDLQELLHKGLEQLPYIQKSVILLRDYEGYDYKEIGEITNLTEAQVKVYIFRGRQFLKNFFVRAEVAI